MLTKVSGGLGLQLCRVQLLGLPPALLIPSRRDQNQSRFGADELQELFLLTALEPVSWIKHEDGGFR